MEKTVELDLMALFHALIRKLWLIVLCAAIAGAAAWGYTTYFVSPLYRASVSIYVNNTMVATGTGITSSDLTTSQKLVATYVTILKSDTVLDRVAEEVGHGLTAAKIRSMMTASAMDETEVFQVRISNANPELAAEIANAVAQVAPSEIAEIVSGSSTKIVDHAKVPTSPYSPNVSNSTMTGALAGAVFAVLIIVLQVLLDVRVRDEADLLRIYEAPIMGLIPDFTLEEKNSGSAYESQPDKNTEGRTAR